MKQHGFFKALGAFSLVAALAGGAQAAQVEAGEVYCFGPEDFGSPPVGVWITQVPEAGRLSLGQRVIVPGDVLTGQQLAELTFAAQESRLDGAAQLGYLPVSDEGVGEETILTIGVLGKEDRAPVAQDSTGETYKNLPAEGKLKVQEPEGQDMTFTLVRQPRRGTVELKEDGSFTYTPKKNKVGVDSFTFTAADPAGNVSREATVTITILKPSDTAQYTDTLGRPCRFAAEWMRHTGIFTGEQVGENPCFSPDKALTRGEFVAMLTKALELPVEADLVYTGYADDIPTWLQPYLAAAVRSGLTAGLIGDTFEANTPITGEEATVMLQNALDLSCQTLSPEEDTPMTRLAQNGIQLTEGELTRETAAMALYQAAKLAGK